MLRPAVLLRRRLAAGLLPAMRLLPLALALLALLLLGVAALLGEALSTLAQPCTCGTTSHQNACSGNELQWYRRPKAVHGSTGAWWPQIANHQ